MCAPAAIMAVTAGVNIASEGVGAKAQDIEAERAWGSAKNDLFRKYSTIQLREQQEMQRTQLQVYQAQQAGASLTSRVRAQLAGGNIAGHSAQEREAQPGVNVENFASTEKVNLANELKQNQLDAESFKAQAENIINQNQPESGAALGLQVAATVGSTISKLTPGGGSN